jgi:transposase
MKAKYRSTLRACEITLLADGQEGAKQGRSAFPGEIMMSDRPPRLEYADRPPGHPVRPAWAFVEALDLSALLAGIRSRAGAAGAPAIDPRVLAAVGPWATTEGVGSARTPADLCQHHPAYRWLCGGVPVSYHTLADFRAEHGAVLDQSLAQSVAVLLREQLTDLRRVARDGLRVRAAAGAGGGPLGRAAHNVRRLLARRGGAARAEGATRANNGSRDGERGWPPRSGRAAGDGVRRTSPRQAIFSQALRGAP